MTDAPVVQAHQKKRAANLQLRVADAITKFAGSMAFIYIHIMVFALWMIFVEKNPWPKLTLVVSLEAIFLSTFVLVGQNRQAEFAQAKANHDFVEQEQELKHNTKLTQTVQELTTEIHGMVRGLAATSVTNITNVVPVPAKKVPAKKVTAAKKPVRKAAPKAAKL